jgi:nucleoside-diphosphate-sugar epimerase
VINHPQTIYKKGNQKRGFIFLESSMQCLTLAIEHSPKENGQYRVFNQFDEVYTVNELKEIIKIEAKSQGVQVIESNIENMRNEPEEHYYNPTMHKLVNLGYKKMATSHRILIIHFKSFSNISIGFCRKKRFYIRTSNGDSRKTIL